MQKSMVIGTRAALRGIVHTPEVYVSSPGIFQLTARRVTGNYYLRGINVYDFILTWESEKLGNNFAAGAINGTLIPLVGSFTANFGLLWKDWVYNPAVQESALNFLLTYKGDVADLITKALARQPLNEAADTWTLIARLLLPLQNRQWFEDKLYRSKVFVSPISLAAAPIRIATCLGWKPPMPRPVWTADKPTMIKLELSW